MPGRRNDDEDDYVSIYDLDDERDDEDLDDEDYDEEDFLDDLDSPIKLNYDDDDLDDDEESEEDDDFMDDGFHYAEDEDSEF